MRILYICADHGIPVLGRKGCSTHVRETCQALQAAGHHVTLLCSMRGDDESLARGLRIVEAPPPQRKSLGYDFRNIWHNRAVYRRASELMQAEGFQAVYERFSLYSTSGTRFATEHNLPRILEVNAFLSVEQKQKLHLLPLARAYERWIVRRAPSIVVVSQPLLEALVEVGVPRERVFIMPMAVDIEHFRPDVGGGAEVRRRWNLGDRYVIGYVGSLSGWHGISMLHEMTEKILKVRRDFAMLVVGGEGDQLERHRRRAEEMGIGDHLVFTGSVAFDQVPAHLAAMNVALVPDTNYWTCPTKMFEYQASGVPTIAPRYPAVLRAMDDGVEGLLFDPRDLDAAVACMLSLADAPERRAEMGRRARERVCATRSWQRNVEGIVRLFEGVRSGTLPSSDDL